MSLQVKVRQVITRHLVYLFISENGIEPQNPRTMYHKNMEHPPTQANYNLTYSPRCLLISGTMPPGALHRIEGSIKTSALGYWTQGGVVLKHCQLKRENNI